MTTSYAGGPDVITMEGSLTNLRSSPGNVSDTLQFTYNGPTYTNGVLANQADREYKSGAYALAASGVLTLNFASLTDFFNNSISFARLKRIFVALTTATTATSVLVGKAGVFDPLVAPSLSQSASGGSLSNGTYLVAYSYITAGGGETKISPTSSIVVNGGGSSQSVTIATITLPSGASGMNVYTSLASTGKAVAFQGTQNAGTAYVIQTLAVVNGLAPLQTSTALTTLSNVFSDQGWQYTLLNGGGVYLSTGGDATSWALTAGKTSLGIVNQDSSNVATLNMAFVGCST